MQMAVRVESCVDELDIFGESAPSHRSDASYAAERFPGMVAIDRDGNGDSPISRTPSFLSTDDLATRMRILIRAAGSMAAIARRCGFSQGAVRSWRDGQSDISRERCVVLARTFGISLVWLMTGEGPMRLPNKQPRPDALTAAQDAASLSMRSIDGVTGVSNLPSQARVLNPRLLAAALRLLQSYIGMLGGSLNPDERADALSELYEILSAPDAPNHTTRLIAFHAALNAQLRKSHALP
jgi:hypothetical protein